MQTEYRRLDLPNGLTLQIKFDIEGIFYDLFKGDEHLESFGYDLYKEDIPVIHT